MLTVDTGTTRFNTAIEYDTDAARRSYSRVKHYNNNGDVYSYEYDAAGNISKITNPDGSWVTYTYNALNMLIREEYSDGYYKMYQYDSRGNLFAVGDSNNEIRICGYSDAVWKDRLTSYAGVTIAYDGIGNPLNWYTGATFSWQHGRQLAGYTLGDTAISYVYNADGIRTAKTVNGVTTHYTVTDGTLRRLAKGNDTMSFVYGNGLSSVVFNGTEYWYVFNAQGDVVGIIDATGAYVVRYTYDAWGKLLTKTGSLADTLGTLNPFRYRGYIYDEETGFYYCQSRYYDPNIGRWLNADKYVTTGTLAVSHNMYAYCNNNPVIYIDDSGTFGFLNLFLKMPLAMFGMSHFFANSNTQQEDSNTQQEDNKPVDEPIVFVETKETLTQMVDVSPFKLYFSVDITSFNGEWTSARDGGSVVLINEESIIQTVTYKLTQVNTVVVVEENRVSMTAEYYFVEIVGISIGPVELQLPWMWAYGPNTCTVYWYR